MKKIVFACFVLISMSVLLMGGCKPVVKPLANVVVFDSVSIEKSYYLFDDTTQPGCNIQIQYVYPDSSGGQALQNLFIEKMFGDAFKDLSPEEILAEYARQYIDGFKQFETAEPKEALVEDGDEGEEEDNQYADSSGYACYTRLKNTVLYNQNHFISFIVETVDYAGGMHSSKSVYAYVVNLATGELLQEEDFAGLRYRQNLSRLIVNKIAGANGLTDPKKLEDLGYISLSDITPNANFTINDKGITYYFNENEIAGAREGIIPVFIPYDEIKFYVEEESPIASFFNR